MHDENQNIGPSSEIIDKPMQPHQYRVIKEKVELDLRALKLSNFIGLSETFKTLDPEEQERMKVQNDIMWQYSEILGKRIAAFNKEVSRAQ